MQCQMAPYDIAFPTLPPTYFAFISVCCVTYRQYDRSLGVFVFTPEIKQ